MANPIVTSLPDYVEQNRLPLIAKTALGARTAKLITLQTGVKGPTAVNLISTDVEFGDGKSCGWDEAGSTTLTQREIDPAILKVNMTFCDKALIGKWAQNAVRVAAGEAVLPFEEEFVGGVIDGVKAAIENLIWNGDKEEANQFEGFIGLAEEDGEVIDVEIASGTDAYEAVKAVYMRIPAAALAEDTVIFCGTDLFREYIQSLVEKNLYHFNPNDKDGEYILPGTNVKVIGVNGLNDSKKIFAARLSEMFYGTDLEGDDEKFRLWYSDDNQEFRLAIVFNAGVQYAFGDHVVLGTIASV